MSSRVALRGRLAGSVLLLAMTTTSLFVRAEPEASVAPPLSLSETLSGAAKRDYDTALILYKSGDFAGAEGRFESAYQATKDVRLLWNAAACEQGQRHYSKAIALLRRYLGSGSPLITEEGSRSARAFLDAALPLTARLIVVANAPGCQLFVDDELVGSLPLDKETRVDFGTHRLVLRKPQFVESVQLITVTDATDERVTFELLPVVHQGRLVVRARHGDSIVLDGRFRALSEFDGLLPSGKHRLRVTNAGWRTFESSVLIEDDRTRALDVTLERSPLSSRIPGWIWVAGGAAVLAGAGTAAYFIGRSPETERVSLPSGSAGKVQLPLR